MILRTVIYGWISGFERNFRMHQFSHHSHNRCDINVKKRCLRQPAWLRVYASDACSHYPKLILDYRPALLDVERPYVRVGLVLKRHHNVIDL